MLSSLLLVERRQRKSLKCVEAIYFTIYTFLIFIICQHCHLYNPLKVYLYITQSFRQVVAWNRPTVQSTALYYTILCKVRAFINNDMSVIISSCVYAALSQQSNQIKWFIRYGSNTCWIHRITIKYKLPAECSSLQCRGGLVVSAPDCSVRGP